MKKIVKEKRSLTINNKARQVATKARPVRGSCGSFANLPPPEDKGG